MILNSWATFHMLEIAINIICKMKIKKLYEYITIPEENKEMINKVQKLMNDYEKYLDDNSIASLFNRRTSQHFRELREMMEDISKFVSDIDKNYNL